MVNTHAKQYDVIIVGAGPTGLACAIEAHKVGLSYVVIEQGGITDAIRRFPVNMTFFSTPELLALDNLPFTTTHLRPTRAEALQYYRNVVTYYGLHLMLHTMVHSIQRMPEGVFSVETARATIRAQRVIVATGYFDATNRLDVEGEDLPHVSHYYDEPFRYALCDVVVVGGRNSAVEAALDLWRHGARVTLVHRKPELGLSVKYWIRPDIENRIKYGEIAARFNTVVQRIEPHAVHVQNLETRKQEVLAADFVFLLIGYRPDERLLRSAGVELSGNLIPVYNPETFETNVPGLYVAGSVLCGCETWSIFIENGRNHAKPIIEHIRKTL
ncbi:MAG: YpdA family putative bacillithiol disulfide reductase [Bacteroidota bacterium]|nr:YpdA family putative bacillithiol disulfide reductase [Candidatus Kapabacteria bacterium]MDW8219305.1 YpdA family putative bacillithiol disulfide reductase [Bacteroidota bacterium]